MSRVSEELERTTVPAFRLIWPIAGLPAQGTIIDDTNQMYSDHLPQLFTVKIDQQVEINLMTYNIYAQAGACGYASYEAMEAQEVREVRQARASGGDKPCTLYKARLTRIAASLSNMAAKHRVQAIAIQEGISPEYADFFKEQIKQFGFDTVYREGQWFLYNPNFFKTVHQESEGNLKAFNRTLYSGIQRLYLQTSSGVQFVLNNVHMEHKDTPRLHQQWLREVHAKEQLMVTIGDFNSGVAPFQLSGRIPGQFIGGKEAYDSTDGCVVSAPNLPARFIQGRVIDPRSGDIIQASTRFPNQPVMRRYRACMSLEDRTALLKSISGIESNVIDIMSVYDVQSGKPMIAFLMKDNNNSPLFSLLSEKGLMKEHTFLDDMVPLKAYIVAPDKVDFVSDKSALSTVIIQSIDQQLSKPSIQDQKDLTDSVIELRKEFLKDPNQLCQLFNVLKVILDPHRKAVVKKRYLDEYCGSKSLFSNFSNFSTSLEGKKRDAFVRLAKQAVDTQQFSNDDPFGLRRTIRV